MKMKVFKLIMVTLAALALRCDDMGHDALNSLGGFCYMIRNESPWSMRLGGSSNDKGNAITCDRSDNIIVTGSVVGKADLDGSLTIPYEVLPEDPSSFFYGSDDIFLSKFDSSGMYQWAKRLGGGADGDEAYNVASDSESNIVVVGTVNGEADLNGDGVLSANKWENPWIIPGYVGNDIFISKFDLSGKHLWAMRLGGESFDSAYGVTIDTNNRIIIAGSAVGNAHLNDDADYDEDGESDELDPLSDLVIASFTSSGDYLWSKRLGGVESDGGYSITHDSMNNVIVTGHVTSEADLNGDGDTDDSWENPGEIPDNPYDMKDIVISKFDSSGNHLWARRLGGEYNDEGFCVKVDENDAIVVTGYVTLNADLDGSGGIDDVLPENVSGGCYGEYDVFISKFSKEGTNLWATRLGGSGEDAGFDLALDERGTIIVTGQVTGSADLNGDGDSYDGGAEETSIYGGCDVCVAKFSHDGKPLWSKRLGSVGNNDRGSTVAINSSGEIIVGGFTQGDSDLNGDGDFVDKYDNVVADVHGQGDVFFTVFPKNYFLFFP